MVESGTPRAGLIPVRTWACELVLKMGVGSGKPHAGLIPVRMWRGPLGANFSFLFSIQQSQPHKKFTGDGFGVSFVAIFGLAVGANFDLGF